MSRRWISLLIWVMALCMTGSAMNQALAANAFEQGNEAFKEGKFEEAERLYRRQITEGGETVAVRFNLGKVREALSDPGGSMLEWERALRLDSGHQPSRIALEAARITSGARVDKQQWWSGMEPECLSGLEGWIVALGGWLVVGAILGASLLRWRQCALWVAVIGAAIATAGVLWLREVQLEAATAVVLERSVTVRGAPADPGASLAELAAGSRVRILGESADWQRCRLPDGVVGWLPKKSIERIYP